MSETDEDRAWKAEAEVERLTRECLDREATETDARVRHYVDLIGGVLGCSPEMVRGVSTINEPDGADCARHHREWTRFGCPVTVRVAHAITDEEQAALRDARERLRQAEKRLILIGEEWAYCPDCKVERTDYEGFGLHLETCPNCGSTSEPQLTIHGEPHD